MGNWKAGILMASFALLAKYGVAQSSSTVLDVEQLNTPGFYLSGTQFQGMGTIGIHPTAQFAFSGQWSQLGIVHSTPKNWISYAGYCFRVQNLENYPVSLGVRWDLNAAYNDAVSGNLDLEPGETRTFYMDFSGFDPMAYGMRSPFPALQETYVHRRPWQTNKTLNSVYRFQIYNRGTGPARVKLGSVSGVVVDNSLVGFVDQFGQYTRRTWPWRSFSRQDLLDRNSSEEADLTANPGLGETLGSLRLPITQFRDRWRVVRTQSGKAYFLTPEGRYFWSLGATSVGSASETIVEGREMMFTGLPAFGDAKAQFYGSTIKNGQAKRTYSYYSANLLEKYGDAWPTAWVSKAKRRFESWGLNTLGSGSSIGTLSNQNIPFTVVLTTDQYPTRLQTPIAYWTTLPDPYGPDFTTWMTQNFGTVLRAFGNNPRLLGAYVDGEHSWGYRNGTLREKYQVPLAALDAPKGQPAKAAFVNQLYVKYGTIGALNAAWGTSFDSWTMLRDNRITLTDPQATAATADLSAFLYNFAKTYAFRVRAAIKANTPNVLWLGSRDSYLTCPNEAFGGLQLYADVISVTQYDDAAFVPWSYYAGLSKPVLISEFSFSCREGNSFPQMTFPRVDVNTQVDRAARARAYMDAALLNKNIIGLHWFTYVDQPITGRPIDAENYAFGLVDVTDRPYQELVGAFRSFTSTMYTRRGL